MMQYSRVIQLVDYFETVVKEQCGVMAFQEKVISKLAFRLNSIKIDQNHHQKAVSDLKRRQAYNEREVNAIFKEMPKSV